MNKLGIFLVLFVCVDGRLNFLKNKELHTGVDFYLK